MSTTLINGHLLLNGDLSCDGDITVSHVGVVNPVPDPDLMKTFYSYQTNSYITANGKSRIMTSTTGDIIVNGLIDGEGFGFESDRGPGSNSALRDTVGRVIPAYGASHAGRGALRVQ